MRTIRSVSRNFLFSLLIAVPSLAASPAYAEEVYMLRGFLNIFSNGMNQMTRRLKGMGIRASSHSNGDWRGLVANIIKRHRQGTISYPIVIVGHSLGGVEVPVFANALGRAGVPTKLAIGLDPGFHTPKPFSKGAKKVLNYKIPSGKRYVRTGSFDGTIQHIDVSRYGVDHVGIDKNRSIQNLVIRQIRSAVGK